MDVPDMHRYELGKTVYTGNGSLVIRVARIFLIYMKIIQLVVTA